MTKQKTLKDVLTEDLKKELRRPNSGIEELRHYLAAIGQPVRDDWMGGHDSIVAKEFEEFVARGKTLEDFYRESETLVYHGIFFGEDQWKIPYRDLIRETMPADSVFLDYGCGVGSDGIKFGEMGYKVYFTDIPSMCTKLLEWRLAIRGMEDAYIKEFKDEKFDLVYAFDVLEHTPQPKTMLEQIEQLSRKYVAVNLLKMVQVGEPREKQLHYFYNGQEMWNHVRSRGKMILERDLNYAIFCIYEPNKEEKWQISTRTTPSSHSKTLTLPAEILAPMETMSH